jgi:hypothetical protein
MRKPERNKVTHDEVRKLFDYDSENGYFIRFIGIPGASAGRVTGCIRKDGYDQLSANRKRELTHRLVWLWVHGYLPEQIDHIDGNRLNNRIANLREATTSQNHGNMARPTKNTSGYKGVRQRGKRFSANIKTNGQMLYIGTFATAEEAHAAYCVKAKELFGEFFHAG